MKNINIRKLLPLLFLSLFALCAIVYASNADKPVDVKQDKPVNQETVPIQGNYGHKIVYTDDAAYDITVLKQDCEARSGQFQECGNSCENEAEVCIMVCAFTCERIPRHKQ